MTQRAGPRMLDVTCAGRTLTDAVGLSLVGRGDAVLSDGQVSMSARELEARVEALAGRLRGVGVGSGDRVAIFAGSRPVQVELLCGAARLGAIAVPVNAQWTPPEVRMLLDDCTPRALLADHARTEVARVACEGAQIELVGLDRRCQDLVVLDDLPVSDAPVDACGAADDPVAVFYTSGTTGPPKGAVWTHRAFLHNSLAWAEVTGVGRGDVVLSAFDGRGSAIAPGILGPLLAGAAVEMLKTGRPDYFVGRLEAAGATFFTTAPAHLAMLLDAAEERGIEELPLVRHIVVGSAPLGAALLAPTARVFPNARIWNSYGASEGHIAAWPTGAGLPAAGAVGRPLPGTFIELEDDDGTLVRTGAIGHVVVRGPGLMSGYWGRPEETAVVLRDGALLVGDLGRFDDDGVLWLEGRAGEVINSGGWKVHPAEVEKLLAAVPGVRQVAVVGLPDERFHQRIVAFVSANPACELDTGALLRACERLAKYKRPREIRRLEELPTNASLKVDKRRLVELLGLSP